MRKIFLCIISLAVLLSACSAQLPSYHYVYTGDGGSWSAQYTVDGTNTVTTQNGIPGNENKEKNRFVLTFKGTDEELAAIKHLKFNEQGPNGGGGTEQDFDIPPVSKSFEMNGASTGSRGMRQNDTVKVTVEWDGQIETFTLRAK